MKFIVIIIALIAVVNSSYSQVFKGKLIDELTNEPIVGAIIQIKNKDKLVILNNRFKLYLSS